MDSEFSQRYLTLQLARDTMDESDLKSPDGPLADYLVWIGLRDADDWWDVGDTPGQTNS